jgi:hypothetical protein
VFCCSEALLDDWIVFSFYYEKDISTVQTNILYAFATLSGGPLYGPPVFLKQYPENQKIMIYIERPLF